jgi:hypothetical protein
MQITKINKLRKESLKGDVNNSINNITVMKAGGLAL